MSTEVSYRGDAYIKLMNALITLAFGIVIVLLVVGTQGSLGGWSAAELVSVLGLYLGIRGAVDMVVRPNMAELVRMVDDGSLDHVLMLPVDAQVILSVRRFHIWALPTIALGAATTMVALGLAGRLTWWGPIWYVEAVLAGGFIVYSAWFLVACLAFRLVRVELFFQILDSLFEAARWPAALFPTWLSLSLTVVFPVAVAVSLPVEAVLGRAAPWFAIASLLVAIVTLALSRLVWRRTLSSYTGASA